MFYRAGPDDPNMIALRELRYMIDDEVRRVRKEYDERKSQRVARISVLMDQIMTLDEDPSNRDVVAYLLSPTLLELCSIEDEDVEELKDMTEELMQLDRSVAQDEAREREIEENTSGDATNAGGNAGKTTE